MAIDILAVGNPLVDYFFQADKKFQISLGLTPGEAHHWDFEQTFKVLAELEKYADKKGAGLVKEAGGCAFNTVRTASALGMSCAFAGGVGRNGGYKKEADFFNIQLLTGEADSINGICIYLVSPEVEGETIIVSVGAAARGLENLKSSLPAADVLLLESFALAWDSVYETLANCKNYNSLYLDLGSSRAVNVFSARIVHLLENSSGTIIGTEAEFSAFEAVLHKRNIRLDDILEKYDLVYKNGKLGAKMISKERDLAYMKPSKRRVLCTAGAGDNFAAAFLFARFLNLPPAACIEAGNKAGSLCVEKPLAVLTDDDIQKIKEVCNDSVIK